ncbi:hypothetical protein UFOVP1668_5 [uncultured Caudovirales phage]|uniref:Uncharacterized protein n=1 Tax=uncultured Caudovirales phage TaxID=2100421 RepID=A0A6J5T6A2_9CAUD|nr:hypothetical protein UFOVP1668_5 [uncultured Caudovirales phage]
MKTVHNIETGEITEVEMTKAELDQLAADNKKMNEEKALLAAKVELRKSIAEKLGLTDDELLALVK